MLFQVQIALADFGATYLPALSIIAIYLVSLSIQDWGTHKLIRDVQKPDRQK